MNIKNKKSTRITSLLLAILMLVETIVPNISFALSGGPSQPEVEGFTPIGTTDMVDLFTGDFSYNIPLMDVDGYPINIGYQSGVSMDQEASWVGLGWNLNPGSVNRSMRGIPDDFDGDEIERNVNIKPSFNIGLSGGFNTKVLGLQILKKSSKKEKYLNASLGLNLELFYNNYKGVGFNFTPDWDINISNNEMPPVEVNPKAPQDSTKKTDSKAASNTESKKRKKYTATDILNGTFKKMYQGAISSIPGVGSIYSKAISDKEKKKNSEKNTRALSASEVGNMVNSFSSYFPNGSGYLPKLSNNMQSYNFNMGVSFGFASVGIFSSPKLNLSVSWEGTDGQTFKKRSYGALYYDNNKDNDVLLDFNRDHEGQYSKNKPILPIPVNMYDIYSISGHGAGGMFRVIKNGIVSFHDDNSSSISNSGGGQLDVGNGTDVHTKLNTRYSYNSVLNGKWSNDFTSTISNNSGNNSPEFENTYFKITGEKNSINNGTVNNQYLGVPFKPKVEKAHLFKVEAKDILDADNVNDIFLNKSYNAGNLYPNKRQIRNQYISTITYANKFAFVEEELREGSFLKFPKYQTSEYDNTNTFNLFNDIRLNNSNNYVYLEDKRKPHHLGEIILNQTNGSRYVYGIAAYNNEQTEFTINIGKVTTNQPDASTSNLPYLNSSTNIVDLNNATKTNIANKVGSSSDPKSDQYFNSTKTPGFAHSYLLSSILQPDYVDIAPKGVGPEDLGNYTKFNYVRTAEKYTWRTPALKDKATFIEGLKSQSHDNKASFVEGSKELWYLQTIQTKNHVAVFVIEPRYDAMAIRLTTQSDPYVTTNKNQFSFRLKRISLYTREEYEKNREDILRDGVPIKTAWFKYDYSLCNGVNNFYNNAEGIPKGKLTLKEVYFTFANSNKKVNSYKFNYSSINPEYNQSNVDRWGNYKNSPLLGEPENVNFPYVKQDKTEADLNASAWLLNEIKLPSGSIINVHYESDDYAYVQNKRAAQMMKIEAMNNSANFPSSNQNVLYNNNNIGTISNNNFLFFKLPYGLSEADRRKYMYECADQIQDISFKILLGIRGNDDKEWVTGYASVQEVNLAQNSSEYFYIKLKELDMESFLSSKMLHPFTKAGFNFAKSNLPFVVNPVSLGEMAEGGANAEDFAKKLLGVSDIIEKLYGINDNLLERNMCKYITLGQSYCRLNEPTKKKLGGGARVKKITVNDAWKKMAEPNFSGNDIGEFFGQEFDYTIEEKSQGVNRKISSGVAAYEPGAGSEENPFKLPIGYTKEAFLAPDEDEMIEGPIGESFFPSPSVGYSRVTVSNIGRTIQNGSTTNKVQAHGVGKTVNEFYTAKDFPTVVSHTAITDERVWTPLIDLFIYKTAFEEKYISQGFSIMCNDMHGKQKSVEVYQEPATNETTPKLLTGTSYKYRTDANNSNLLNNNNVSVIDENGKESQKTIGVESEMYADTRQSLNETTGGNIEIAFEVINLSFLVFPFVPVYPDYSTTNSNFYSSTLNKVTTVYGLVDEVKVIQDGSEITTKNLSYDALTGEVLITQTVNEYDKNVYNTTYPSHWIKDYDYMGPGYKNIGISLSGLTLNSNGNINYANIDKYLTKGDEVLVKYNQNKVLAVVVTENGNYKLYNSLDGALINNIPTFDLLIIRSGRRNMQTSPVFAATSLENPLTTNSNGTSLDLNTTKKIIDAKATTYQLDNSKYMSFSEEITLDSTYLFNEHITILNYILNNINLKIGDNFYLNNQSGLNCSCPASSYINLNIPNSGQNIYNSSILYKSLKSLVPNNEPTFIVESNSTNQIELSIISNGYPYRFQFNVPNSLPLGNSFYNNNILNSITIDSIGVISNVSCNISLFGTCRIVFKDINNTYTLINANFTSGVDHICLNECKNPILINSSNKHNAVAELKYNANLIKPKTTLVYKGERTTDNISNERYVNTKGVYKSFNNFYNLTNGSINTSNIGEWKVAETATLFDPYTGSEIESKDALGRYRSVLYLKDQNKLEYSDDLQYGIGTKPQMYIENGKQSEATVFNFESNRELRLTNQQSNSVAFLDDKHYFEYEIGTSVLIDNIEKVAHSGNSSLRISSSNSTVENTSSAFASFFIAENYNNLDNAILPFYPIKDKKYVISGWVKSSNSFYDVNEIKAECKVEIQGKDCNDLIPIKSISLKPSGPIIDGWQRFYGEFMIENGTSNGQIVTPNILKVSLINNYLTNTNVYFDDIRIHPFDANAKSYVYDNQHRIAAVLDENNYATFYMYNIKGELVTVRRETEKGIVTIQENRKNNSNIND